MKTKIVIIGSTGKLGIKLLNYCKKSQINVFCITCFQNSNLLKKQSLNYNIRNCFVLSKEHGKKSFSQFLNSHSIDLIYFLDYGYSSLKYAEIFLKNNKFSQIAIANKEMIIAGGSTLIKKIKNSKNTLIPLDSEHFSLFSNRLNNKNIKKIFITASGGPFYFKKKINLEKVNLKSVLLHPKWKMGINNSIDSSNFINKILEIFELSIIYEIDIKKIDFLISQEAYIHSIVINRDNVVNINCFENDMLIPLIKPLEQIHTIIPLHNKSNFLDLKMLRLEKFTDNRFKLYKYFKLFKKFNSNKQISFMILNNIAHKKYLSGDIKYNDIIDYIMSNLKNTNSVFSLNSIDKRLNFIQSIEKKYEITN